MKVLVFDTETTGLPEKGASIYDNNKWPHIIQLSYILYDLSTNLVLIKDNYIKIDDRNNAAVTSAPGTISNLSKMPYSNPRYTQINSIGRS